MTDPTAHVHLRDISHAYDDRLVLEHVHWQLNRGDRWALLGPSGAGKTTLLEILTGLTPSNRGGTVVREGDEQINLAEWRRNVGWLSTDLLDRVPDRQSVLDTVVAGKHAQTLKAQRSGLRYSESDEDQARSLLDRVNLGDHPKKRFGELSQGQRQLVLVARCLMGDPELLVFDEPCAGLDPGSREDFLAVLDRVLAEETGTTILYVTHHVEEILPEFTNLLVLKNGSVQYAGPKEDFLGDEQLDGVYSEDFELTRRNGRYWPIGRS